MQDKQLDILEKIVALSGDCLDHKLCNSCPFRKRCLPEFVTGKPMSKKERMTSAMGALFDDSVMGVEL